MPEVNLDREDLVSSKENPLLCPSAPWRNGVSLLHQDIVEHQESRTQDIVAVVTTLWILAYIAVGARVLGRFVGRTKLWWDDWIIFLAAVEFSIRPPHRLQDYLHADTGRRRYSLRL